MRRFLAPILITLLSLAGIVVTADALVTTPGEELEQFADRVSDPSAERRVDSVLAHVSLGDAPCRLSAEGKASKFAAGEDRPLAESMRTAFGVFDSDDQEALQQVVENHGDKATVTVRVGDSEYEQTVIYELVRHDDRWLVRSVRTL